MNNGLDEMVEEFHTRKLEADYPVIWVDALYEKIHDNYIIVSKAVIVIKVVNLEGQQEILAVESMENESEETYSLLFRRLQERGLEKVCLCVSDAHRDFRLQFVTHCMGTTLTEM